MALDLQKTVKDAFSIVKNVAPQAIKSVTYTRVTGTPTYDTVTGNTTVATTTYTVDAVLTQFKQRQKDYDTTAGRRVTIEHGDLKMLAPYTSLPFEPSLQDNVTVDGVVWSVVNFVIDPTMVSLHTIQLRRS